MVHFRIANKQDIPAILKIIEEAKYYLKEQGVDQWQNGTPNQKMLELDIQCGNGYVLEEKGIIAYTALIFKEDESYQTIYEGEWITNGEYAVIHRTAVRSDCRGKGMASLLLAECERMARRQNKKSLRIDTHNDNKETRHLCEKQGFQYCGWIVLQEDQTKRLAYEKIFYA